MALPADIELMETLGEGSFGRVYVARISEGPLRRTVVLKVLKGQWVDNDEVLRRSTDEAVLLARLNHDHIVKVEQLTSWQERPVVVMEHIQGLSLDRVLRQYGPLPVAVALEICGKVAAALDAAWHFVPPGDLDPLCVIHRDIKPSNIILSVHGAVKVLDFGTARAQFDSRQAETRSMAFGSLPYMAPECFDGRPPTPAVDVYALGATLYELVGDGPLGKLSVNPRDHLMELTRRLEALHPNEIDGTPALDALTDLIARSVRYEASRRPSARELRDRCRELAHMLPNRNNSLDTFAEDVVARFYRVRAVLPPVPMGDSLEGMHSTDIQSAKAQPPAPRTGILRAGGGVLRSGRPDDIPLDPVLMQSISDAAQRVASAPPTAAAPPQRHDPAETLPPGGVRKGVQAWSPPPKAQAPAQTPAQAPTHAPAQAPTPNKPTAQAPRPGVSAVPKPPPGPEAPAPAPQRSALPRLAMALGFAVVLVGGAALAWALRSEPDTPQSPKLSPMPPPQAADPVPEAAPDPGSVTVTFVSVPSGAQVEVAGERFTTPASRVKVPSGTQSVTVRFPDGPRSSCSTPMRAGDSYLFRLQDNKVVCP